MRRVLPLLALLLTLATTASATGVLNVLLGAGGEQMVLYAGTVTAANNCPIAGNIGYYSVNSCGSISPSTDEHGNTIETVIRTASNNTSQLQVIASSNPGQSYFTTLTVNGSNFNSSAATYSYAGGLASWIFSGNFFTTAGSYALSYH